MTMLSAACKAPLPLPDELSIAINVAPQQIQDEWLAPGILAILNETGFPPHRLEVELTEHALVTDLASAKRVISSLKSVGIKIALDDFGTGYSSLCYLSELPFDKIKIDRSFISDAARARGERQGRERHRRARAKPRRADDRGRRGDGARGGVPARDRLPGGAGLPLFDSRCRRPSFTGLVAAARQRATTASPSTLRRSAEGFGGVRSVKSLPPFILSAFDELDDLHDDRLRVDAEMSSPPRR